jgi:hypothetical protein
MMVSNGFRKANSNVFPFNRQFLKATHGRGTVGVPIGTPKAGAMDCSMVAAAPVLPPGYVVSASRIANRRMILAAYRLADLLIRVLKL